MASLRNNITWILILVAIVMAVGCLNLPIGYYTFMRIVVCIAAVLAIVANHEEGFVLFNILFALIAILFNPIIPIHLHSKVTWTVIDAIGAVWMGYSAYRFNKNK